MTAWESLIKSHNWGAPANCPICGHALELNENHTKLFCPNYDCKSVKIDRINTWTNVLGIKEWAPKTIEALYDATIISNIASLYTADYSKVANLEGFGKRSAEILEKNIKSVETVSIQQFIAGFNIDSVGETLIKNIVAQKDWTTLADFLNKKKSDFVMNSIGEITAEKIFNGLQSCKDEMLEVAKYVTIKEEKKELSSAKLAGKSFCFTGAMEYKRSDLEKMVTDNGGEVKGVSKGLSFLVQADPSSTSGKSKKAKELGIEIITPEAFLEMLK